MKCDVRKKYINTKKKWNQNEMKDNRMYAYN